MYDLSYSLDIPFFDINIRAAEQEKVGREKNWSMPFSVGSKLTGFEFGSPTVLGWQKLTCYFITCNGYVYHLTPCLPLKFGIENAFFEKLYEKGIKNTTAIKYLTLLKTKKRVIQNDQSTGLVTLSESEYNKFLPELQGPVRNPKLENTNRSDFIGLMKLNTFPQTFVSYTSRGELFIQISFEEPEPLFSNDESYSTHSWITKE